MDDLNNSKIITKLRLEQLLIFEKWKPNIHNLNFSLQLKVPKTLCIPHLFYIISKNVNHNKKTVIRYEGWRDKNRSIRNTTAPTRLDAFSTFIIDAHTQYWRHWETIQ